MDARGLQVAIGVILAATVLLIFIGWLFYRLIASRFSCPRCGSEDRRGSETKRAPDSLLRVFGVKPQRCLACGKRFYCFGQPAGADNFFAE